MSQITTDGPSLSPYEERCSDCLITPFQNYHGRVVATFDQLPEHCPVLEIAARVCTLIVAPVAYLILGLVALAGLGISALGNKPLVQIQPQTEDGSLQIETEDPHSQPVSSTSPANDAAQSISVLPSRSDQIRELLNNGRDPANLAELFGITEADPEWRILFPPTRMDEVRKLLDSGKSPEFIARVFELTPASPEWYLIYLPRTFGSDNLRQAEEHHRVPVNPFEEKVHRFATAYFASPLVS